MIVRLSQKKEPVRSLENVHELLRCRSLDSKGLRDFICSTSEHNMRSNCE